MKIVSRLLLFLLLLCSQGVSVCADDTGATYGCIPKIELSSDCLEDDCKCPCDEGDCEEHEFKLVPLLVDSVKIPSQHWLPVPTEFADFIDIQLSNLSNDELEIPRARYGPPIGCPQLHSLMTGVVQRL